MYTVFVSDYVRSIRIMKVHTMPRLMCRITGATAVKFVVTMMIAVITGCLAMTLEEINSRLFEFKNQTAHNIIRTSTSEEGIATLTGLLRGLAFHTGWTVGLVMIAASGVSLLFKEFHDGFFCLCSQL